MTILYGNNGTLDLGTYVILGSVQTPFLKEYWLSFNYLKFLQEMYVAFSINNSVEHVLHIWMWQKPIHPFSGQIVKPISKISTTKVEK